MLSSGSPQPEATAEECLLCRAEHLTAWLHEDDHCWVAECMICRTPMVVWRIHGLPDAGTEAQLLGHLERAAAERYGVGGYSIDLERRRIPDHWHAHARPADGFFDPSSELFGRFSGHPA